VDFYRIKDSAKGMGKAVFEDINCGIGKYSKHMRVNINDLKNEGWSFLNNMERSIIGKLRGFELSTFCDSYQGIITGCDDAFVIEKGTAEELKIETELLKPWIKNKNVRDFSVSESNEFIIYSDLIKDENKYPNAVKYIERYKEKLQNRRECSKGLRRWYELQWGRNPEVFEGKKIIYPYKASKNRFALDCGSYFSADVYTIKIKDMFLNSISYEFLVGVLNSSIYEFYIKTIAKKLGDNLYEFYPNKIMTLKIPQYIKEIENEVLKGSRDIKYSIDMILLDYFGLTLDEYSVIRSWCV
jgi:adenine-specific DNA-methyltransferase